MYYDSSFLASASDYLSLEFQVDFLLFCCLTATALTVLGISISDSTLPVIDSNSSKVKELADSNEIVVVQADDSEGALLRVTQALSNNDQKISKLRDICPGNANAVSSSRSSHPPHTDGVYQKQILKQFLLQCVTPDNGGGGQGIFWRVSDLLESLPVDTLKMLRELPIRYRRYNDDGQGFEEFVGPVITEYGGERCLRWRYDRLVRPQLLANATILERKKFDEACASILNFFATNKPIEIEYSVGTIVLINNQSVLHGRRQILGDWRHFRRAWLAPSVS